MALRNAYLIFHRQVDAHFAGRGMTADQFVLMAALADGDAVTKQERGPEDGRPVTVTIPPTKGVFE
jgi:hypothetical protein